MGDEESQFGDGDASRVERPPMDPRAVVKAMESMDPETRARWEDVNLRCLTLCIGMLERVNGVRHDFYYIHFTVDHSLHLLFFFLLDFGG